MRIETGVTMNSRGRGVLVAASLTWPLFATPALAAWDVTIAAGGSSSGGAWAGNTWTASASGATVLASEIEAHLANGATRIETGGSGNEQGDLTVNGAITWNVNTLTLSAARDIDIQAALTGTGTAALALAYGQGAPAAGNQGLYRIGVPVTLSSNPTDLTNPAAPNPANFTTTRGSDGIAAPRAVPTCPVTTRTGWIYGCDFLASSGPFTMTYQTVEMDVPPDVGTMIYLPIKSPDPATVTLFPFAWGVQSVSSGKFRYPSAQNQPDYFDAFGNILPGTVSPTGVVEDINTTTISNDVSKTWYFGPIHTFYDTRYYDHGYYIQFQPTVGELGRGYQTLSILVTYQTLNNTRYSVIDYVFNVLPAAPSVSGGNLSLATSTPGSENLTLTGTGPLTLSATSSNPTLLPDTNISGAAACIGAGLCTLTLTPVAGQRGTATVTLTLSDTYRQQSTVSFTVNVTPLVPSVSVSDVNATLSQPATAILTLAGSEGLTLTAASDNTALLPNANITGLAGCNAAGTCALTLTPVAGQLGTANVTLTMNDTYGQQAVTTFAFNVSQGVSVTYDGNGQTGGSVPVDGAAYLAKATVTVSGAGDLTRTGHTFAGWNTQPDGSGTSYAAGATFPIGSNITLYAQWTPQTTTFSGGGALSFPWLALLLLLSAARPWLRRESHAA